MAGGLYGGIKFSSSNSGLSSSEATILAPIEAPAAAAVVQPAQVATDVPAPTPNDPTPAKVDDSQKKSAGWSAALSFAPTRRKAPATQSRPAYSGFATTTVSTVTPTATISSSAVISAPPVILQPPKPDAQQDAGDNSNAGGWKKKIQAPSMVLDEDVNGFRAAGGKKKGGAGSRKKGKNAANAPPAWDPMEPYDPHAPNDYYEYKAYKQKEREDYLARRQAELREESRGRKRSWKDGGDSEESDSASEDSRDYDRWQNRPRKTGPSACRNWPTSVSPRHEVAMSALLLGHDRPRGPGPRDPRSGTANLLVLALRRPLLQRPLHLHPHLLTLYPLSRVAKKLT
ncbi:hypothetical protein FRC07_014029 [Ceratobasidium sp. 392]|nr:hypothetical protein FRC07_014029 [Ceratobasidium sp. 392]